MQPYLFETRPLAPPFPSRTGLKSRWLALLAVAAAAGLTGAQAKVIVVNTADNLSAPPAGQTNLVQALGMLQDGDSVHFNIPGAGVHYIDTPPGGYPLITANNVTIDGYSQPGATPNSNPLHAPNNAALKIVLTSTNGNALSMGDAVAAFAGHNYNDLGFGHDEYAILGFFRGSNAVVRGLAIISAPEPVDDPGNGAIKSIAFCPDALEVSSGNCQNWRVSGCWFGLDPATRQVAWMTDGSGNVAIPAISIAAYRTRNDDGSNPVYAQPGTIGVAAGSTNPAAEINLFITGYGFDSEGLNYRISGNWWNVLPDGMTNFDPAMANSGNQQGDGYIEVGRAADNMVIGTDGDGVNDAYEGNVFAGVDSIDWSDLYLWSAHATNVVISGNWYGVAVDGLTRFTNSAVVVHGLPATGQMQFGSDFDGVSDALEGNVVYDNNPFDYVMNEFVLGYPPSTFGSKNSTLSAGTRLSFRGNKTVNNSLLPYTYADNFADRLNNFTNYEAAYMDISANVIPALDATNSVYPKLVGTFAPGLAPYTNVILDVYQLDLEGWNNGKTFGLAEMTDYASYTNGFPQGSKYLGSFPVSNTGAFSIDLSGLDLGPGRVVVTANYSADRPGTHGGQTHTSNFSDPVSLVPAGPATAGSGTVVPDVEVWYNTANPPAGMLGTVVVGPVNPANATADLSNWEPYTSVLGDSTFLVGLDTYADDQTVPTGATYTGNAQRYIVVLQPAKGGAPGIAEQFFTDAGAPYRGVVNLSRENGNPERVAADKRYGAANFISEAETSAGQLTPFRSDTRWNNNPMYQADNRYVTEQVFSINPGSLVQTPLTKAWDFVYGPTVAASLPSGNGGNQLSRTGGRPEFLDNGNIVVMIDDKTAFQNAGGEVTTFSIITPSGSIVKGPTLVDNRDIWDNMAAFRGGFAIRVHDTLYFYDNSGTLMSSTNINTSSGLTFGTGREDASRIASDIRSHYVYLAGQTPENSHSPVSVAIWDARTGAFVAKATVQDIDTAVAQTDRVSVGVDPMDRFCVAYCLQPTPSFTKRQIAARVMAFDGTNITYLTPPFFPFVNHVSSAPDDPTTQIETYHPNVSMTLRQILIAGKGSLNSTNNPAGGQDTNPTPGNSGETKVYTVVSHPDPIPAPLPTLQVAQSGANAVLTWGPVDDGLFTVQWASALTPGAWSNVTPAPAVVQQGDTFQATVPVGASPKFFRLARW